MQRILPEGTWSTTGCRLPPFIRVDPNVELKHEGAAKLSAGVREKPEETETSQAHVSVSPDLLVLRPEIV